MCAGEDAEHPFPEFLLEGFLLFSSPPSSPRARQAFVRRWPRSPESAAAGKTKRELIIQEKGVGVILGICFTSTPFFCSDLARKALIGGGSDLQNQLQ